MTVHCRPVAEVPRSRPTVGSATVRPLKSIVMSRVVRDIAATAHHLRFRSVIHAIR